MIDQQESQQLPNAPELEDFRMRYRVLIDDIRFSKTQQWRVAYYIIALFFGIAGLRNFFNDSIPLCYWQRKFLIILPWVLSFAGAAILLRFQRSMQGYREQLKSDVVPHLSKCFKTLYGKRHGSAYFSFWKDFEVVLGLIVVMFIGSFLLTWLF